MRKLRDKGLWLVVMAIACVNVYRDVRIAWGKSDGSGSAKTE